MQEKLFEKWNKVYADIDEFKSQLWEEGLIFELIDGHLIYKTKEYLEKSIREIVHYMVMDESQIFDVEEEVVIEWVKSRQDIKEAIESYCKKLVAYNNAWVNFRNF